MKYLVTGCSGFLAKPLIKRLRQENCDIVGIARNEGKIIEADCDIITGDITDDWIVKKGMKNVDGIFHLAAFKHVGLAENNAYQCAMSNVVGTTKLLQESYKTKPKFVIGISTDKAAQVSGVYGASKLIMEALFREAQKINPDTQYRIVRYGNVLYSTGSVLCKWKERIEKKLPVFLTDKDATRFFWTKEEAVDLIFDCLANAKDATPYTPKMKAMSMGNLLEAMMEKYGLVADEEIGLQPGENMHETMDGKTFSNEVEQFTINEIKEKI